MKNQHATHSQNQRILDYLRNGGELDPLTALRLFDSWALRSRICEIEGKSGHRCMLRRGERIVRVPVHNRRTGKRYMQYKLEGSLCRARRR